MIEKRLLLGMCLCIGFFACGSFFALLYYFDPYIAPTMAILLLAFSFLLWQVSWSTFILYFIKKVYYRGEVHLFHVASSLRQSLLLGLYMVSIVTVISLGLPLTVSIISLGILFCSLELFVQSLY